MSSKKMGGDQNKPFFSIVTCTLDSAEYLEANIESVASQSFSDYEHLFVDGESQDGTLKIIKNYTKRDDRVKYRVKKPEGISNAMNVGAGMSNGHYLIYLHSDDRLNDKKVLKKLHEFLIEKPHLDWIYGKIRVIEENGELVGSFPERWWLQHSANSSLGKWLLKLINYVPHQAVVMKNEVLEKWGGFDESLSSKMDYDLWLRIEDGTKWEFVDILISKYMIRPGAQSSSLKKISENKRSLKKVRTKYLDIFEQILAGFLDQIKRIYKPTLR